MPGRVKKAVALLADGVLHVACRGARTRRYRITRDDTSVFVQHTVFDDLYSAGLLRRLEGLTGDTSWMLHV